jgi:hypothetical protein
MENDGGRPRMPKPTTTTISHVLHTSCTRLLALWQVFSEDVPYVLHEQPESLVQYFQCDIKIPARLRSWPWPPHISATSKFSSGVLELEC